MLKYILIAEDHPICAEAIKLAAQTHDSTIFVIDCDTLKETQAQLDQRKFDALVLDLGLKDSKGLLNLGIVRANHPELPVLIISGSNGPDIVTKARQMGASGFLNKEASLQKIGSAIGAILNGEEFFEGEDLAVTPALDGIEKLSKAQLRVMQALQTGRSNKVIAHELGITEPTVKSHLSAIYRALGVTNRSQAILHLQQLYSDGSIR